MKEGPEIALSGWKVEHHWRPESPTELNRELRRRHLGLPRYDAEMAESGFALVESEPIVAGDHPDEVSLLAAYGANNKLPDLEIQSKAP